MPVKYIDWMTRDMICAAPNEFFVFGDNMKRVGYGGQAAAARGEPNSLGVATLYEPGKFYDRAAGILPVVMSDLMKIGMHLRAGSVVNVPRAGLGTGLGRLIEHRPDIHNLIVSFFKAADGEPCQWGLA